MGNIASIIPRWIQLPKGPGTQKERQNRGIQPRLFRLFRSFACSKIFISHVMNREMRIFTTLKTINGIKHLCEIVITKRPYCRTSMRQYDFINFLA